MTAIIIDALILLWLISTWFYEGHHRRCSVISTCPSCGKKSSVQCESGKH